MVVSMGESPGVVGFWVQLTSMTSKLANIKNTQSEIFLYFLIGGLFVAVDKLHEKQYQRNDEQYVNQSANSI